MKAARAPRRDKRKVRLLVVSEGEIRDSSIEFLPDHIGAGDLLVVNDAATLPASLYGRDGIGNRLEVRLRAQLDDRVWQAVVFGAGDWHTPTEERPSPPRFKEGDDVIFSGDFRARVLGENELSARLLDLEFNLSGAELWRSIYLHGKPVQYSYMDEDMKLWAVQNVYSSRPWAVEMASAGHALDWRLLLKLMKKGVRIVSLTHGAGLSSTGDADVDRALPLAERFEIPQATMEAVRLTRAEGSRVIAVGTSVVRALESASLRLSGFTDMKIDPGYKLQFVDGLLTGTHEMSESHYQLLGAFLPESLLLRISNHLAEEDYLTHEFGDSCLLMAGSESLEHAGLITKKKEGQTASISLNRQLLSDCLKDVVD
ncbi:MAG: S-adenosylmethionine:tRNA ribosyltransferase-isomerase [Blastocatellia bacterium]|nr:S-adenosylmethionine:tRNA ribosyltransferase-isomerase [Blastocatellia bacterium]